MTYSISASILSKLKVPKKYSVYSWAEDYAYIPASVNGGVASKWKAYPYQKEILEVCTPGLHTVAGKEIYKVSLLKTTRCGYNRILSHVVGFISHQMPRNIGIYEPNDKLALDLAKEEILPMFLETPCLNGIASSTPTNDGKSKITHMKLPNNTFISITGASPANFRRRNLPVLILDETDGMSLSAGKEGDPVILAENRTRSNVERMIILGSSPVKYGESIITKEYNKSDMRKYHVPCPHCGHEQVLEFERFDWKPGKPETVVYPCENCGKAIEPKHKAEIVRNGRWKSTTDNPLEPGHAGFHITGMMVLTPNTSWPEFIKDFENAQGSIDELQAFYNTRVGIQWSSESQNEIKPHQLLSNTDPSYITGELPNEAILLVASVDVQGGGGSNNERLEVSLWAFGRNNQMWFIVNFILPGDPLQEEVWDKLDDLLNSTWSKKDGTEMQPYLAIVDSGGHSTAMAYEVCRDSSFYIAIHGSTNRESEEWLEKTASTSGEKYVSLGVHKIKNIISQRLKYLVDNGNEKSFIHFPSDISPKVAEQMCSERLERVSKTSSELKWVRKIGVRNEIWDCAVYAWAGMRMITDQYPINTWDYVEELVMPDPEEDVVEEEVEKVEEAQLNPFMTV